MLSCFGVDISTSLKSVTRLDGVNKVSHKERGLQMRAAVNDIAAQVSEFVHHIVPHSSSAIEQLKGEHEKVNAQCLAEWKSTIQNTRTNMVRVFQNDMFGPGLVSRHCAVVHAHSQYAIDILKTKTGNCAEQAFLAGIVLKAVMVSGLKLRGFSEKEIANAHIQCTIVEFRESGNGQKEHGQKEHTLCMLSYDISGEQVTFVDPWVHGAIVDQNDADQFYAMHISDLEKPLIPTKVHNDKTNAINDELCMSIVMQYLSSLYEINLDSLTPFGQG